MKSDNDIGMTTMIALPRSTVALLERVCEARAKTGERPHIGAIVWELVDSNREALEREAEGAGT